MNNKFKIAVCVSGQMRTWKQCVNSWFAIFENLKKNEYFKNREIEVDYFVHTWDFDSTPFSSVEISTDVFFENNNKNDFEEVLKVLNPKKFKIENINKSVSRREKLNELAKKNKNESCVLSWSGSQLYSTMVSGFLKREYELENNFEYDICMKFRFDLFFSEDDIKLLVNEIQPKLKEHTIYCVHSKMKHDFPWEYVGDIFFYSDSITYDILSSLYNWLPFLQKSIFRDDIKIEEIFAYTIRMFKIKKYVSNLDPKIIRKN